MSCWVLCRSERCSTQSSQAGGVTMTSHHSTIGAWLVMNICCECCFACWLDADQPLQFSALGSHPSWSSLR